MYSSPRKISAEQARRIAIGAQGLARRTAGRVDRRHLRRAMSTMKVLQLDSIPIVTRTQYLVLRSRVGDYDPSLLDRLAYQDHEWLETWAHEASLISIDHEPLFRWRHDRARRGETWKNLVRFAQRNKKYVEEVRGEVAERGRLRAAELSDPRPNAGEWWGSRSGGTLALDWLFRTGEVGIVRSPRFDKSFDLLERLVPAHITKVAKPTIEESHRRLLEMGAEALGVATAQDLADYFRLKMKDARPRIEELVEAGVLLPAEVEGWDQDAYVHAECKTPRRLDHQTLLSPFDPLMWKRDRVERLFGFDYRIEIYVPAAKRRWGYYVLPFLMGEELAARVDLKSDRKEGVLRVLGAWLEEGQEEATVRAALEEELQSLATWLGLEGLVYEGGGDLNLG